MKKNLDPNWVTGFVDGEGCFSVHLSKRKGSKLNFRTIIYFQIKLHIKDKDLLLQIKDFFKGIGTIVVDEKYNFVVYKVMKLYDIINIIIPHFDKYSLITTKYGDYILWRSIVELVSKDQHLDDIGFLKIVSLKSNLNKGLSLELLKYFPNQIEVEKAKAVLPKILNKNWIAGFFSGEGCFSVAVYRSNKHKLGYGIILQIIFTQHLKNETLFNSIKTTLECGNIFKYSTKNIMYLRISKFEDINNKIIPMFKEYSIKGTKFLDFKDFCRVTEIINKGSHLGLEGLEEIRKIKLGMNRSRIYTL
jgi:hypothetical protein